MKNICFILVLLIAVSFGCKNSTEPVPENVTFQNGDFENGLNGWEMYSPEIVGMYAGLETSGAFSGDRCIRSSRRGGYSLTHKYTYVKQLITDFPSGGTIVFTGYISYSNINEGTAALAVEFLDEEDRILRINATDRFIKGVRGGWQQYTVNAEIPSRTRKIYVYCIHDGDGTAYFDCTDVTFE